MKKLLSLLLALLLVLLPAVSVAAETTVEDYTAAPHTENPAADPDALQMLRNAEGRLDTVTDLAHLLSAEELAELTARSAAIESEYGITLYLLTLNDFTLYTESDLFTLAEDIYDFYALGCGSCGDGMLLVLSMAERDYTLISHGANANYYFTDYGRNLISDAFLPDLADNNWYDGFCCYYDEAEYILHSAFSGEVIDVPVINYDDPQYQREQRMEQLSVGGVAGFIVALISCVIMKHNMKSARLKKDAGNYIADRGVSITSRNTVFLHASETRVRVASDNNRSSFGGGTTVNSRGFSGHSGKF